MKQKPKMPVEGLICPLPLRHSGEILLGHGSGGMMTVDLIKNVFQKHFSNPILDKGNDFADLILEGKASACKLVVSTDAHIVKPIFFPGGDIGRLAVAGTVNDVSMSGAQPAYLTASFILEEGLPVSDLDKIAQSMKETADEAGVLIVAGDTKVAEKGSADRIFISTTGIGFSDANMRIHGQSAEPGDAVIISGTIGDHGIAVLAARGELGFRTALESDVAPLNHLIQEILDAGLDVHVLRDPTRGGLATTLNEIALQSGVSILLDEEKIPVKTEVASACEMLGFDPLYVANEGKVIVILPSGQANEAIEIMKENKYGKRATVIGWVNEATTIPRVTMSTRIGGTRIVDTLSGEMLPRIC